VFNSNYRPTAHKLSTIHERDEPITKQPTMQRCGLLQYAPLAVVSATHRNSALWGNQIFPTTPSSTHAHISKAFFLSFCKVVRAPFMY